MIPVAELDKLAQARLDDAKALLAASRFDGATYLCGYAVEMALKARTCRVLNWPEFWNAAAIWKSESRYNVVGTTQKADAEAMVQATEKLLPIL